MEFRDILNSAKEQNASDVHLQPGQRPILRIDGRLEPWGNETLCEETLVALAKSLLSDQEIHTLVRDRQEIDAAFSLPGLGRYRLNAYLMHGAISLAIRCLKETPPALHSLGLPEAVAGFAEHSSGLVLVTGPTGSGKSTTLAALLRKINEQQDKHILTIEDPVEYLHTPEQCIISQREIGRDTTSFGAALRAALRQDPDVILVGEMRDPETIRIALTAAETGHLVLSTLHTNGAVDTVNRIVDVFAVHQQQQIRTQLSATLQGIVCQTLVPAAGGHGRVAAAEILVATPAIRHQIRDAKTHQIQSSLETGSAFGMQTMEQALTRLKQEGRIL